MTSDPAAPTENRWPGERLGLPATGPRSVGRFGRRLVAILIDWGIAYLLSWAFFPTALGTDPLITLGIFALLQYLFLLVTNGSLGHLIVRLRVVPLTGGYLGLWRPAVRTLLLSLAIPALIWDRDQRGLHDKAAGTILLRV
ncbi:MAG: RDD family protein [Leifsonia xyli]|nr:MAG: RDD family protein [Leifsonia xyli]